MYQVIGGRGLSVPEIDLYYGIEAGDDVRKLQILLNHFGFKVAEIDGGSPRKETDKFFGLTRDALIAYQKARGISPTDGYFGPITRARMKTDIQVEVTKCQQTNATSARAETPKAPACFAKTLTVPEQNMVVGAWGPDANQLQILLNHFGFTVAKGGPGTPGKESAFFGVPAQDALITYQKARGISSANDDFGLETRTAMEADLKAEVAKCQPLETSKIPVCSINKPTVPASIAAEGDNSSNVKELQTILNHLGFKVAETGDGSPGNEIKHFGPATKAALIKYQIARGVESLVHGYFTWQTMIPMKADLQAAVAKCQPLNATSTSIRSQALYTSETETPKAPVCIAKTLIMPEIELADSNDVKELQILLNHFGFYIEKEGPGSPGREHGYNGPATQNALLAYKKARGIDPGIFHEFEIRRNFDSTTREAMKADLDAEIAKCKQTNATSTQ